MEATRGCTSAPGTYRVTVGKSSRRVLLCAKDRPAIARLMMLIIVRRIGVEFQSIFCALIK
jgi:hypothetical protein